MPSSIRLPDQEWAARKLYVATPMYGGSCSGRFVESILDLQGMCRQLGVHFSCKFLYNESLLTRGRNLLTHAFLMSECTHMLFVDSDMGFSAHDAITMLGLMSESSPYDVLAGAYPTKHFNWDRIRQYAQKENIDLSRIGNRFVVDLGDGMNTFPVDRPVPARYAGTGFMMIRRSILDNIQKFDPSTSYISDVIDLPAAEGGSGTRVHMYFQAAVDIETQRYLSEDYWFCQRVAACGGQVWICPWLDLTHVGSYAFRGSLADFVG